MKNHNEEYEMTDEQYHAEKAEFLSEIVASSSDPEDNQAIITIDYPAYNTKRYGRPWMYKVKDWGVGQTPDVEWGGYTGDRDGGILEILASSGDIVRHGQRDYRGKGTRTYWAIVQPDFSLEYVSAAVARKFFLVKKGNQ